MDEMLSDLKARLEDRTSRGLANAVSRSIRDGKLRPGTRLPPIRTVATSLNLSPTTVSAGWSLLARSGAIRTDGRRGTIVADLQPNGAPRYRRAMERQTTFHLDLSTGVPDVALLPCLNRALEHFTNAAAPGGYLDDPVVPELVEILRAGWPYDAEEFTVVDGAMDALDLAARALVQFGDRVVIEHPCFPPLFDLLEAIGADIVGVPVDDQGLSLAAMRKALSQPVTAVFIQPRGQNPTGVSLSTARAGQLAGLLGDTTTLIIEDDLGPVATTAPISLGQWLPEQTLHVRGFSKSHGPDLRLAAVSGPARLIREIVGRRQLGQGWTSRLLQRILLNLLTDDHALSQIAHACAEYARRRAVLVTALAANGIEVGGTDGLNIWVPVHDESAAIMRLASQGIGVTPGSPFAVLPGQPGHIRITCGLLADGHSELAAQIAAAARTGGWTGAR